MKVLNMKKATKRYNDIMFDTCCEFATIGTNYTEEPKEKAQWNLRDMVAEADYHLSCYTKSGHARYEDRLCSKDDYKIWLSEKGKLERFVKAYEPFVADMKCYQGHCSRFDN